MKDISYYIRKYKIIPEEICKTSVKKLSKENWQKHQWYDAVTKKYYSRETDLDMLYHSKVIDDLNPFTNNAVGLYLKEFEDTILERTNIRFNRYKKNQEMHSHYDHIRDIFDGTRKGIPVLSILGFLNSDYEGGEFYLANEKINTKTGDILIFPSCFLYPHEVKKVTKGTRYSFISWGY